MTGTVVFIQGAGDGAHDEDLLLVERLRHALEAHVKVRYPEMPNEDDASFEQWRQVIEQELADVSGPVAIAGHSVGASIVLKWLSERTGGSVIAGVFLMACPFWGGDGWLYEGYEKLALPSGVDARIPQGVPIFIYHCRDDETVPFAHLSLYARDLPQATVRAISEGGHQFGNDLTSIARDIEFVMRNSDNYHVS